MFRLALLIACSAGVAQASPAASIGVMGDVGVPDGAVASLVYRPTSTLRLHAGVGNNLVSNGARAGITLVPLSTWATPTLSLDYGRYFEGDANPLARRLSGDAAYSSTLLERVGYDYANGHVGVELGRERATFYLHAGVSRVTSAVYGLDAAMDGSSITVGDSQLTIWSVSGRVGLIVYVL